MDFCFPSIFIASFNDELKVSQSLHCAGTEEGFQTGGLNLS